jgi:hypothetical protein
MPDNAQDVLAKIKGAFKGLIPSSAVTLESDDTACVATKIGEVRVCVVPYRSEFEINFSNHLSGIKRVYPLWALQRAFGIKEHAIMYSDQTINGSIDVLKNLLVRLVLDADVSPDETLKRIAAAYDEGVLASEVRRKRSVANELWNAGNHNEAARIYEEIPDLTKLEEKRIEIARRDGDKSEVR